MFSLGFIGAGNMAGAIITGIIRKDLFRANEITIFDIDIEQSKKLSEGLGVKPSKTSRDLAENADTVILAVKPDKIAPVVQEIKDILRNSLTISIAAGVTISSIQSYLGVDSRVIRVMPNAPALVLEGASAFSGSHACRQGDIERARSILGAIGTCQELDESLLNAITGLSGSGPAFCFIFMEALADGGVRAGLDRDVALQFAATTMKGAAQMVLENHRHPAELKDMVCSPAGTTIEGVHALESKGMRSAVMDAVHAAYTRAMELSGT